MKVFSDNQNGFTLIELIIAVSLSSILFLMVATMLVADHRFFNSTSKKLTLASDASAAMSRMRSEIMLGSTASGSSNQVSVEGDSLIRIGNKYFTSDSEGNLIFNDGTGDKVVFKEIVSSLLFAFPAVGVNGDTLCNAVSIELTVADGNLRRRLISTVWLRN